MTLISQCQFLDIEDMIKCLTGAELNCCFVAGIGGCILLIDGEPITIS